MCESKTNSHVHESEIINISSKLVIIISGITAIIKQVTYM